jgi:hypothetical protein
MHGKDLGDIETETLCRDFAKIATELGIADDLPVPPHGLPGVWSRKPDMQVMLLIRLACEYPIAMAVGESRSLWNIHDAIKGALEKAFNEGWSRAHRERDEQAEAAAAREKAAKAEAQMVYFIQSGDNGSIKIGIALNPQNRLRTIQTSHPEKLHIRALTHGGIEQERDYHQRFADHRLHGEWFRPHPDILAEIESLKGLEA